MPGFHYPAGSLVAQLDADSFEAFIKTHERVFIHFGAAWNSYDYQLMPAVSEAASRLPGKVSFAVIDVDEVKNHPLCQEHQLSNVPFVEYYVGGKRLEAFVGYTSKEKSAQRIHPTVSLLDQLLKELA